MYWELRSCELNGTGVLLGGRTSHHIWTADAIINNLLLEVFEVLKISVVLCQENGHFSAPSGVGYNPQMCQQNQVNAFW